jgi:putative PIN family toxin of toxin-antitoxin system
MIRAILDTNILVQAVIGSPPSASALALDAYYERKYLLIWSPSTIDELIEVMLIPQIKARHEMTDDEVPEFAASLQVQSEQFSGNLDVKASIPRDVTDRKLLALAAESNAGFLVTNDHRHLLRLGTFGETQIVGPGEFLRHLASLEKR